MKKLMIGFMLLMLAGCTSVNSPAPTPTPDGQIEPGIAGTHVTNVYDRVSDMSGYPGVDEDHVFISIEYFEVLEMIENKDSAVIYIGRPGCAWCLEAAPVLNEIAKEYDQSVYYVHTRSDYNVSDAGKEDFKEITAFLYDYLNADENGERAMSVPDVLYLKNGEIAGNHIGTVESHDAHERTMTEEELSLLIGIYRGYFDKFMAQ